MIDLDKQCQVKTIANRERDDLLTVYRLDSCSYYRKSKQISLFGETIKCSCVQAFYR